MKNRKISLIIVILLICLLFTGLILGSKNSKKIILDNDKDTGNKIDERFIIGHTFSDDRYISFTFSVPYYDGYLSEAFSNELISLDEFIGKLEYVSSLNDGGSKLYRYNSSNKIFGNDNFNVLVCNSIDVIKDTFVAKNMETLNGLCSVKINEIDGVSMEIKEGTLTRSGVVIIITDTSDRDNIYGEEYRLDRFIDGEWKMVDTIIDNYAFNSIGYKVTDNNKLEMKVNWEWLYGKLVNGKYRVVKDTSESGEGTRHYLTVEFDIK